MKRKSMVKWLGIVLTFCMAFVSLNLIGPSVSAAGFSGSGKGTAKKPYLVTNAAQLDEMRNNLSATYKLANNIDMSQVASFTPIGKFSAPFTGTFTCDTASDGTPKYIIKNLTINHRPAGATLAGKYSGYKKDKSMGWEAGFFGQTKNATLKNIVILNANVTSTVEGNSSMNSDWSTNPGQSLEQSAGILVGTALNTKITGCGSSGTVKSASNNVGGLVGTLSAEKGKTGSLKNSYSYANVTSTGKWNSGGFCGGNETYWDEYTGKVTISNCFYNGTFSGSYTSAGAFSGPMSKNGSNIKDCWSAGKVLTSSSGCFYATDVYGSGIPKNTEVCENCYTLSVIEGRNKAQTNKTVTKNNWITDAVGGLEIGFAAGSQAEISAAFANISGFTVAAGAYPQLKDVHPITNPDSYVPLAANAADNKGQSGADKTASDGVQSGTDTDTDNTVADDTDKSGGKDEISTVIESKGAKISTAEKVLYVVLSVIIVLLIAATVYLTVKWSLLLKDEKTKKNNGNDITDAVKTE